MKLGNIGLQATIFVLLVYGFANCFMQNPFGLGRPGTFDSFQMDSQQSVTLMMEKTKRDGLASTGGFMVMNNNVSVLYLSAWGLQGKVFSRAYSVSSAELPVFVHRMQWAMSIFFAALLAAFVLFLHRELGSTTAAVFAMLVCLSDWLVFAARNLYLVYPLHILPFLLSFMLFPKLVMGGTTASFILYLAAVGGAVLLKSLCYLDYSSNIVLSTACGPIFYGIAHRQPARRIAQWSGAVLATSAAAVFLAILAIGIQMTLHNGTAKGCFDHILRKAAVRSLQPEPTSVDGAPPGVTIMEVVEPFLTLPVISLPFTRNPERYRIYLSFFSWACALLPTTLIGFLDARMFPQCRKNRRTLAGLAAAAAWGLGATLSWAFLMKGHMYHHLHINGMICYIPYMLVLYMLIGKVLAVTTLQIRDWAARGGLPSLDEPDAPPAPTARAASELENRQKRGKR
jgi:hypothetical protein